MTSESSCRICGEAVAEFLDFGIQPLSDAFREPSDPAEEFTYRLAVGRCAGCGMVQLVNEVPREAMFHDDYPYVSRGSAVMREHFGALARRFLETELAGEDPFIVELGSNDGTMLATVAAAGVRHLGVEPSGDVADLSAAEGVRVRKDFFEESTALQIAESDGLADVIYAANTLCHIPYMDSILAGVRALLKPHGVFVFEDPYLGDIVERTSFDQIYDEHFFLFSARSVDEMARRHGLELVDVEHLEVHGGELRYTLALPGARRRSEAVGRWLSTEDSARLGEQDVLEEFAARVHAVRDDLVSLLSRLRDEGSRVVGYGATAKSATVTNFCGIGPELVEFVCDTTPAKQGRLTPGSHIPVRPPEAFRGGDGGAGGNGYPPYALLFAWNHAEEIMAKEQAFREAGGRWILYVPTVRVV
ncbi:class I SAM-dependent methyltransferase [Prauserella rugosa]|uniref:Methylation protein EvaC n=1 Tax=Prauserella rugosa TaxID=43354 RepID=A0A660CAF0_9PSEU|nr:class I SAM-dependent methyltransferase [Prauserella rugosa]KMS86444.1 SAM-dependent methyltransferase [Streptomyces regensis]TWH20286.1 methylation protein EvaC [Prauserella rugosa]